MVGEGDCVFVIHKVCQNNRPIKKRDDGGKDGKNT